MKKFLVMLGLLSLAGGCANLCDNKSANAHHVLVRPDAMMWGPPPPGLPAGSQTAVLLGDPTKPEHFVLQVKMPDGYQVPPHWHSKDENITVLKGTLLLGHGDKLDQSKTDEAPAGSFCRMPARMHHFAIAKGDTLIQLHGTGPFDITYINPADDPRRKDEAK